MRIEFPDGLSPLPYTFGLPKDDDVVSYTYSIEFTVPPSSPSLMDWHMLGAIKEAVGGESIAAGLSTRRSLYRAQ